MNIIAGTTDCMTGKPVFFDKNDMQDDFTAVKASSSLPLVSKPVKFSGMYLLDGGVSAPIPIERAIEDGSHKNIVVLTREKEFYKTKRDMPKFVLERKYRHYPELVRAMLERPEVYNNEKKLCYSEQENGHAFVIEPSKPVTIGRYCTKSDKLEELYDLGVEDTKSKLSDLRRFMALNSF